MHIILASLNSKQLVHSVCTVVVLIYTSFVVDSHWSKLQTVDSQCRQWS
jgi:hypothetical protein